MNFSKTQNMAFYFSSGVLILCKNQQMKDCSSILILMISLHFYGFKTKAPENNYLYFHF